jgi:hypothetical protein
MPDRDPGLQPPLVTELFQPHQPFTRILHNYPRAEAAAADIRPTLKEGSVALEAFLRTQLRDSPHAHHRRRYLAIPLYLQHLFFQIGAAYTLHPDNYDRLISAALELDEVVFVTLNYDDLFDKRLFQEEGPLTSMDSYLGPRRNWGLIKLHGSVNWGRGVVNTPQGVMGSDKYLAATFAALGEDIQLDERIVLRLEDTLLDRRVGNEAGMAHLYYPALSAPLGSEDELVCPPEHQDYLRRKLSEFDGLNVLVIGYSGLDQEVMRFFRESGNSLRSLYVVNGNEERGLEAADKITRHIGHRLPMKRAIFPGGFTNFVQEGSNLADYIRELD